MPADPIEIHDAEEEGVHFHFLTNPIKIHGKNRMDSIESIRMELGEPDASGRRRPVEVKGSEFMIKADTIIMAIGQEPDVSCIGADSKVQTTRWATFVVNEDTFQTDVPEVFAGGDAMRGPCTVVECIADGRNAATQIDRYLRGQELTPIPGVYSVQRGKSLKALKPFEQEWKDRFTSEARAEMPMLDPKERIRSFIECETGFPEREPAGKPEDAWSADASPSSIANSARSVRRWGGSRSAEDRGELHYEPDVRHPFIIKDQNKCILCGACVRTAMSSSCRGLGFVDRGYVTTVQPSFGSALQETDCESCGTCVQTCPTGSLDESSPVPRRFRKTWMPGVCTFEGFGCHLPSGDGRRPPGFRQAQDGDPNRGLLCKYGRYGTVTSITCPGSRNP